MSVPTTRRFELGLPLFSGLDLGLILKAQTQIQDGDFAGLTSFISTLGATGQLRTIRKLAAIWTATDLELRMAEQDPKVMAELEDKAAERPFAETFQDAIGFQSELWIALGLQVGSSAAPEPDAPAKKSKKKTDLPSAD